MKKSLKTIAVLLTALLAGGTLMTACDRTPDDNSTVSKPAAEESHTPGESENLARKSEYYYDTMFSVDGDPLLGVLNDGDESTGVRLCADKSNNGAGYRMNTADWNGNQRYIDIDNGIVAFSFDFGFMSTVASFSFTYSGDGIPENVKVFASTDGYNFTSYLGAFSAQGGALSVRAKALQFVFETGFDKAFTLNEVDIQGTTDAEKILLSKGASYEWAGAVRKAYPENDEAGKLTDGVFYDGLSRDSLLGKSGGNITDTVTRKTGSVIKIDLGEEKNVSEVGFAVFKAASVTLPDRIDVRYSTDGTVWNDLGQSFLRTSDGGTDNCSYRYNVTRNHTVKARYIDVYTYTGSLLVIDELAVYGCEREVEEPDYGYTDADSMSNTNITAYRTLKLNGTDEPMLSDMYHTDGASLVQGKNTVTIPLGAEKSNICSAMLYASGNTFKDIAVTADGKAVDVTCDSFKVANKTVYYICFDPIKATNAEITFTASGASSSLCEAALYASQRQLPTVNGGFFQVPTNGAGNPVANNSEYSWYLQLKGMRDLGMEYVVIQYSAQYTDKTTLINGKNIVAAGYKYNPTYGAADMCEAVLDAADKLGMKVWLGTMHGADFTKPSSNEEEYKKLANDAYAIIKDIYEMYSSHSSFAGYYLSDETCDQWLNAVGGVKACRFVYKSQSDYIRSVDGDAKIMIAPAIWRSGAPATGGDNLYRMIAPENEGEKPVVDIVAAQDCLGRTQELYVTDGTYADYEKYVDEWAKAVRRAGSEFWHDAEVFEQVYTTKRSSCVVESLMIEAKTSGTVIVFDIPHYFTTYPMTSYDEINGYYKRCNMRDYVEYYSVWTPKTITCGEQPDVITDDGKKIEDNKNTPKPLVYDKDFNPGMTTEGTPTIGMTSPATREFTTANGSGNKPAYTFFYDSDAFYIYLKTNDGDSSFGKGQWWEGKDDLVQIWISGIGERAASTLDTPCGLRYYLHCIGEGKYEADGQISTFTTTDGITYEYSNGVFLIKMPWKCLGRSAPEKGDGTTITVNIQYIDGSDGTWASLSGSSGTDLTDKNAFSF